MLNSSYVAEIKIGQGAKPGEGGHLPGKKVSEKVAAARNASPGTDLISPSNNHDLYSIEDLAELIDELKTVNPDLRVSVKVPVVPNIGTIGLGIAKAGADIITLSGFEGGTGAARQHALRHVGLPSDIGTRAVHRALMEAGIRNRVEIWADGGYRHGHDVVKLHCMGANRVAFGTLAMVSLGCTICRGCQLDTCHVGIATQIETTEQAQEHGLKKFTPQEVEHRGRELRPLLRRDGRGGQGGRRLARLRARPGPGRPLRPARADLAPASSIDLAELITPLEEYLDLEPIDLPVAEEELVEARAEAGLVRRAADPHGAQAGLGPDRLARRRRLLRHGRCARSSRARPTPTTACSAPSCPGAIARAPHLRRRRRRRPTTCSPSSSFNGGSVAGQGFGAFNAYGVVDPRRGRRPGRRRQDDARRHGRRSSRARAPRASGSTARSASRSPTAPSAAASSSRARPTRASASASPAPTSCSAASPQQPIDDSRGCIVDRANAKGFAFEYMTSGRAVVLGDIGPWACAGMTGGRVYVRVNAFGIDRDAIERRLGEGAQVELSEIDAEGMLDIEDLLGHYADELRATSQDEEAERMLGLAADARRTTS